jgi:hypothetical protein
LGDAMTNIVTEFGLAAALLSTSAEAATQTHPRWMIGQWAWVSPTEALRRGDCPESEFYGRNGYVTDGERVSRWWIEGDYLVRVTVEPGYGEPSLKLATSIGSILRELVATSWFSGVMVTCNGLSAAETFPPVGNISLNANVRFGSKA